MPSTESQPFAGLSLLSVSLGWRVRYGVIWSLTVLLAPLSCQFSAFLTKPANTVTFVGNTTRIECSRNVLHLPAEWEFAESGSDIFFYIYARERITENVTSRYKIDKADDIRYDIVIDSVDFSHAGTYRCTLGLESATAELIVIASDPVCRTDVRASKGVVVEGDYIKMSCPITYNGNWYPVTSLNRTTRRNDTATSGISRSPTSTTIYPSTFIRLTSSDNGVTITWTTRFEPRWTKTAPLESLASNYQYLWSYTANVSYGVRNLTIEPTSVIYEVGDRLVCWADGNPSPTFQWTDTETNRVIGLDGPILTLNETMPLMQNLTFKCTARNSVANESKEIWDVATFMVTAETPGSFNPTVIIVLTVAGVIALVVLLALGLAKAMRRKTNAKGDSVNVRSTRQTSYMDEDYDKIDESNIQVDENYDKIDESNIHVDENYDKIDESNIHVDEYYEIDESNMALGDNLATDGYSSLQQDSSAAVANRENYDPLQRYLTARDAQTN